MKTDNMPVSLLACLCLFALSQALEHPSEVKSGFRTTERDCPLQSTMSLERCILPPSEILSWERKEYSPGAISSMREEHSSGVKSRLKQETVRPDRYEFPGMEDRVPERTYCMVNATPETAVVHKCWNGQWLRTNQPLPASWQPHVRKRRGWCWWWCKSDPPRNKHPSITCPSIPNFTAPEGEHSVKVTWSPATARDPEDGQLSVRQTSGGRSGTYFSEGRHSLGYEAKDSRGARVTCTVSFTVIVHRCNLHYIQASANMEKPACQPLYNSHPIYGTECTFECKTGYKLVGVSKTKCIAGGHWQHSKPVCEVKKCRQPTNIAHGSLLCGSGADKYDYASTCDVICDAGYQVQGVSKITCQLTQQWTHPGTCRDVAPPDITCGQNIHKLAGPRRASVNITFSLPSATDNSGEPVSVTSDVPSGSLFPVGVTAVNVTAVDAVNNLATCAFLLNVTVIYCPSFNASSNSSFSCSDDYVYGSDCTTTCDPGYYLTGDVTQTCLQDQTWSGQQPLCKRSICPKPDVDSSGLMQYDCPNGHYLGESCSLSCSGGNSVIGPKVITCETNTAGVGGPRFVWNTNSTVPPTCTTSTCPKLSTPRNGALVCTPLGNTGETCAISCDERYMRPARTPERYTCFKPALTWNPDDHIPMCYGQRRPNEVNVKPDFYYSSGSCSSNSTEIRENFLKALQGSYLWQAFCTNNVTCTIADVEVTCHSYARRRKRDANTESSTQFRIQISPKISLGPFIDQGSYQSSVQYYDALALNICDELYKRGSNGDFNVPDIGIFDGIGSRLSSFDCQPGTILDHDMLSCAVCGEGHIYEAVNKSCSPCPAGTYQDQEIGFICIPCPGNAITKSDRSSSLGQCHEFCPPGSFSSSGDQPCDLCPKGSYQTTAGMTSCDLCPFGMSTPGQGATRADSCQFYDVELSSETPGPRIKLYGTSPSALTLLTWVHVVSTSPNTTLTFSLDPPSDDISKSASLSVDGLQIYLIPTEDMHSQQIRTWYHLSAVYYNGTVSLYLDGTEQSQAENVTLTDLWRKTIMFSGLDNYQLVLHGLQATGSLLSKSEIQGFATSCDTLVEFRANILKTDEPADAEVVQRTCDDKDDCQQFSCRERGTCVDGLSQFTCLCDDPWSGDTCQVGPDLCDGHQCANGGSCVSDYDIMNYRCVCVPPYGGPLCQNFTGCPAPELRRGHNSWQCLKSETTQSQSCEIICDPDLLLLSDIDNNFECGPSTNYSWSHQTEDNPTGILPDCSVQRLPTQAILEMTVVYDDINCSAEFPVEDIHRHVDGELENTLTCVQMEQCYFRTQIESTCGVASGDTSTSLGNMTISIYLFSMVLSDANSMAVYHDLDSDSSSINTVRVMAQQLTNQSDVILNFTIQGRDFTGKFESTEWHSSCPLGTQMYQGICLDCPAGFYSPGLLEKCFPCPVGFYQDQPAQMNCHLCTNGTTVAEGAYSEQLCT